MGGRQADAVRPMTDMRDRAKGIVTIVEDGRAGRVTYREAAGEMSFPWEISGGDVVASVRVGTAADWRAAEEWAAGRRAEIVQIVADEVIRQRVPGGTASVDEASGWMHVRDGPGAPARRPAQVAPDVAFVRRFNRMKARIGLVGLVVALIVVALLWLRDTLLTIAPGAGTPIGRAVRFEAGDASAGGIAMLIRTLEPYVPSLSRNHGEDRYSVGVFIVPLDGAAPRLVPISGGHTGQSLALARILGSDGRTLWLDAAGRVGGVDLQRFELLRGAAGPPAGLPGANRLPFEPDTDVHRAAGYFTGEDTWLGLHADADVERSLTTRHTLRPIVSAESARQMRRLYRGTVGGEVFATGSRRIRAMEPIGEAAYLNAAFLRRDARSEPIRLRDPDGALMLYTSRAGLAGTVAVARVDDEGAIVWSADTQLDAFALEQILPGEDTTAFIGTRVRVPGKVPEPLLVLVEHASGRLATHSLWR